MGRVLIIIILMFLFIACNNKSNKVYRDDGSLFCIGEVDSNGMKQGKFEYYDEKRVLFREFIYRDDVLYGKGIDFYANGSIQREYFFESGEAVYIKNFDSLGKFIFEERGIEVYPKIDTIMYGELYIVNIQLLGPPLNDSVSVFSLFGGDDVRPIFYKRPHGIRYCGKMLSDNIVTIIDTPYMAGPYIQNVMINYNFQDSFEFQIHNYVFVKDTVVGRSYNESMPRWAVEAIKLYEAGDESSATKLKDN